MSNRPPSLPASLLVRADGGRSIGAGHVVRALTLAEEFKRRGVEIDFAIRRSSGRLLDRVRDAGHDVIPLDGEPLNRSLLDGAWPAEEQSGDLRQVTDRLTRRYTAVLVDHYGLDAHWESRVRPWCERVVAVDDLANRTHDADLLIDQNWYGSGTAERYGELVPADCLQLLGPRYAILQRRYAELRTHIRRSPAIDRLLVSFGGSDPTGETERVVAALSRPEFAHLEVDVVLGTQDALTPSLRQAIENRRKTSLHVGLPTLADPLSVTDLAIGASGSGTWERMCLEVPAIVTTVSAAHSGVTRVLAEAGLTIWAGIGGEVSADDYARLIAKALSGEVPTAAPLVDGAGAARIAEACFPDPTGRIDLRTAAAQDAPMFSGADTGAPAGISRQLDGPTVWNRLHAEFLSDLEDPNVELLVVAIGGVDSGAAKAARGHDGLWISFQLDDAVAGPDVGRLVATELVAGSWSTADDGLRFAQAPGREAAELIPPHATILDRFGSFRLPTGTIAGL